MAKKNKSQKAKSDKNSPTGPKPSQTITPNSSNEADLPPLPNSAPTDSATGLGNRKGNPADDTTGAISDTAAGTLPSTGGLTIPGETVTGKKEGEDDKGSLQIKIHLNLHAKVKLELDAQIYGDIVIGLL